MAADLQWFVDHVLPSTGIVLVLSGSLVGLMEREIEGGGAPLYGGVPGYDSGSCSPGAYRSSR